jgi:monothiol glutaredoxin
MTETTLSPEITTRIEDIIHGTPVVLFMKGEGDNPLCGFSAQAVTILNHLKVPFTSVNILDDEELRQGLKVYGDWPTFPQLYVNGELIGGADIMTDMFNEGELEELLAEYRAAA